MIIIIAATMLKFRIANTVLLALLMNAQKFVKLVNSKLGPHFPNPLLILSTFPKFAFTLSSLKMLCAMIKASSTPTPSVM